MNFHPPLSKQLLHGLNWHQQQANEKKRNKESTKHRNEATISTN
jgi:hypothetical protein